MKNAINYLTVLLIGLSLSSFTNTTANKSTWKKLGSRTVNFKLDKDVLHVGLKDGRFSKLKLAVSGGSLNMHKMTIEYGNGQKENINLKHNFSRRSASRVIDINGNKRVIKNIVFWYDTKNRSKTKARLTVFGK